MIDIAIVGAGPAGITAAIYSARKKLSVAVFTKNIGGQAALSGEIENYTGFQLVSGVELSTKFETHMKNFQNIDLRQNEEVLCVEKHENHFSIQTIKGTYDSKTVIMATGRKPRLLGIPGEKEYKNKGVTYCATCDGPIFSGKDVAIIGGGNSALDATLQMINIANKVYLININDELSGETVLIDKVKNSDKVEILNKTKTLEIKGETFVNSIVVENKEKRVIPLQGIFVEIGSVPVKAPACGNIELNKYDEIIVNDKCETNVPGLFAAGDVTNVPFKQIIVAAGQGCIASLTAFQYIQKH